MMNIFLKSDLVFYFSVKLTAMRKVLLFVLLASCIHQVVHASIVLTYTHPEPKPGEVMIPLLNSGKVISLEDFLKLTPTAYKQLTGKKLTLNQKIDLSIMKHLAKKMIRKDGSVDMQKMRRGIFGGWSWHWGGFALGFFLSLLGPIIALFFNDDYKWDRFWTALHTSVWIGLIAVVIVAAASGGGY
jgi:hypothetical protein